MSPAERKLADALLRLERAVEMVDRVITVLGEQPYNRLVAACFEAAEGEQALALQATMVAGKEWRAGFEAEEERDAARAEVDHDA